MLDTKLSIRGVKKSFLNAGSSILVLDQVSIDVRAGEFLILAGKSGCGKSTLLNIVAGLESADSGEILIDGFQVRGPGPDRAMVFQDGSLFPWLTAVKNVEFGLRQRGVPPKERFERATHFLTLVGLERFANACIHELSGGMRQRVAIARALAVEPRVLLMDEPFSALDAQTREDLYIELQRIWERTAATILFVTHNIREAVTLGDRVLLLRRISDLAPGERACSVQMVVPIEIMRPRHIDDVDVARFAKRISLAMRHGDQDMSAPEVQFDEDDLYKTGLLSGLDSDLGHAL